MDRVVVADPEILCRSLLYDGVNRGSCLEKYALPKVVFDLNVQGD